MSNNQKDKTAARACPICSGRAVHVLHHQRFALAEGSPLPDAYDVVACDDCSFAYADTPRQQQEYDQYYEISKYEDPNVATGGGDSELDLRRMDVTAAMLAETIAAPKDRARILDVGCAGGGLLRALRQRGFVSLSGLDPSPACVARVRAARLTGIQGKVSDPPRLPELGNYDAVVLSHVLEHVVNVHEAVDALRRLMSSTGILYIEVPDASRYLNYPFVPFYYFDTEHINHFDGASLANLGAANRLRVLATGQKELTVGEGQLYPAVWAIFSLARADATLVPSVALRDALVAYVAQSVTRSNYSELELLAARRRSVALWGAGSHSQRLLKESPLGRCRIVAVVDRDRVKQGQTFAGRQIQSPEAGLPGLDPDAVIVIASVLHAKTISRELRSLGISNDFVVVD